jgi:hypothetical protein
LRPNLDALDEEEFDAVSYPFVVRDEREGERTGTRA